MDTTVERFLERLKSLSRELCGNQLVSIRQFGSAVDEEYREGVSDVDVVILVSDECSKNVMDNLRRRLVGLETEHNIAGVQSLGSFQRGLISRSALFKSHFVVHRSALEKQLYPQLFEEAEVLGLAGGSLLRCVLGFLLPWKLVLANIVSQSRLIEGSDTLGTHSPLIAWQVEAARSFLVALMMSAIEIILIPFSGDVTRLSLESVKWYLIDAASCLARRRIGLKESIEIFRSSGTEAFLRHFTALRAKYSSDRMFSLACPLFLCWFQSSVVLGKKAERFARLSDH